MGVFVWERFAMVKMCHALGGSLSLDFRLQKGVTGSPIVILLFPFWRLFITSYWSWNPRRLTKMNFFIGSRLLGHSHPRLYFLQWKCCHVPTYVESRDDYLPCLDCGPHYVQALRKLIPNLGCRSRYRFIPHRLLLELDPLSRS